MAGPAISDQVDDIHMHEELPQITNNDITYNMMSETFDNQHTKTITRVKGAKCSVPIVIGTVA
jgi:hypothetical protein